MGQSTTVSREVARSDARVFDWDTLPATASGRTHIPATIDAHAVLGFNFPTVEGLKAAAAAFPTGRAQGQGFQPIGARAAIAPRVIGPPTLKGIYEPGLTNVRPDGEVIIRHDAWASEAQGWAEGSWPELVIAPGMVECRRRDKSAEDRARDRAQWQAESEARHRTALQNASVHGPMVFALTDEEIERAVTGGGYRTRGQITKWSRRSMMRLVKTILQLDLAPLVSAEELPVMLTLTLPDRWLELAPTGEDAARLFEAFGREWRRRYGAPSWIWKREFQRRGAPHWHLWLVPPARKGSREWWEWREWVAATWTRILNPDRTPDEGRTHRDGECRCSEWCRSIAYGTNVSAADGMKARDPKRLAHYFLKESGTAERKAYQNQAPWQWHGSIGRFWGVVGIRKAVEVVQLPPELYESVYDAIAEERAAATGWERVDGELVNVRTGVVVPDPMGGWAAVASGPDFALRLAVALAEWIQPPPTRADG